MEGEFGGKRDGRSALIHSERERVAATKRRREEAPPKRRGDQKRGRKNGCIASSRKAGGWRGRAKSGSSEEPSLPI